MRSILLVALLVPQIVMAQVSPNVLGAIIPLLLGTNTSATSLSVAPTPSTYGQSVRLTATVAAPNPTGTVTFYKGGVALGSATLTSGTAVLDIATLPAGVSTLTAAYGGDANTDNSTSAAIAHTVSQYASTATLTATPNPAAVGQGVSLTLNVAGTNPTGIVTFKEGATVLGTASVVNGAASFGVNAFSLGTHSLRAEYAGDSNHLATAADLALPVRNASASTLSVSTESAVQGQSLAMTATVTGVNPTGVVTFKAGTSQLGTASLTNGRAMFSTGALGVGAHSLTAVYGGDTNNVPSTAAPVIVSIVAASPGAWQYGYDATGRVTTVRDPNSLTTYTYYDGLGRPIQTQQPANVGTTMPTTTDFTYNLRGDLTQVADPRNLATTYTPNAVGDVTAQTSPDAGASQYAYDANGNVLTKTDARGKVTQYAYDKLNRVTSISYPTGIPSTFEYDGGATTIPAAIGKLTKMTDESGQTTYTYDSLRRLTTKTVVIGSKTFTMGYAWGDSGSALDKLTAITYPSGTRVNYSYDQYGRFSGVTVNAVNANGQGVSGTATTLLSGITYNAENRVTGWLWSDGKARTIGYDANGMVSSYNLGDSTGTGTTAGLLRSVQRDAGSRITGYTHINNGSPAASFDQTFGYDDLDRLTSATQSATTIQYGYDDNGNRKAKTIAGTAYANTISAASNRLNQVQDATGTATISHDAAGNVVGDGNFTFAYSDRGRMSGATTASGTVSYAYNGLEQRVKKSGSTSLVQTGAAHYLYDEAGQLLGEYDANGTPLYETIYLGSTPVGALKQTGTAAGTNIATTAYNVHADHINTPRFITKQDETIVWRWDGAEAFGATAPDQNPTGQGTFVFNQRFPGQVFDQETGLFQNWNRDYRAAWGRYIQSDPIGLDGGINTYGYAGAAPLSNIDPEGLAFTTVDAYCRRDPATCIEVMGDMARSAGALSGDQCVAEATEVIGDVANRVAALVRIAQMLKGLGVRAPAPKIGPDLKIGSNVAEKYAVGPYKEIRGTAAGMDAHHVGQKTIMEKLIPGYDPLTAPAILVPKVGHTIKGPNGIVSRSVEGLDSVRDVLARDVRELRRVYSDISNASLKELIRMNKEAYPAAFRK